MKKLIFLGVSAGVILGLAGCGSKTPTATEQQNQATQESSHMNAAQGARK